MEGKDDGISSSSGSGSVAASSSLDELGNISLTDDASSLDEQKSATMKENRKFEPKNWKPKFTLRSHLDVVHAVSFHPSRNILISASEDSTIKLWSIDSLSNKKYRIFCFMRVI